VTDAIIAYIAVRFYNIPLNRRQSTSKWQLFASAYAIGLMLSSLVMCMKMVKDGMPIDDIYNNTFIDTGFVEEEF